MPSQEPTTAAPAATEVPRETHRWNFWVCASEAAIYVTAMHITGPMTLIPFLFKQVGIDNSWLGLFTISWLFMALAGPLGLAMAGGRQRKLPFCIKVGACQRLAFVLLPIGVMLFFSRPTILLVVVVGAWFISFVVAGIGAPVFEVLVTSCVRERWWGRRMSVQNALSAAGALAASGFVWWVNRSFAVPANYILLGWICVALMFVSLFWVSRIREVPLDPDKSYGPEPLGNTFRQMGRILRDDVRIRWLVTARVFRVSGFFVGTYMTAVFIERCGLTHAQMWIPVVLSTLPHIGLHVIAGRFVDHYGVKPAMVLSAFMLVLNALFIVHCYSLAAFVVLFTTTGFGGSLLVNSWGPLLMKLAPPELRPAYFTTVSLAAAPGSVAMTVLGIVMVRYTGFDYVFYISAVGGAIATVLFLVKLPHIRSAPTS